MIKKTLCCALTVACLTAPSFAQTHRAGPPGQDDNRPTDPTFATQSKDFFTIRYEPALGSRNAGGWLSTQSPNFVNIPQMAGSFIAHRDDTNVEMTFSAEAYTDVHDKRLFVRALIDGKPADPSDIVFTEGSFVGARSFTFTTKVDEGVHTVEMQWLVDQDEQKRTTAYMRGASILVRKGRRVDDGGSVWHFTPPSGPNDETTVSSWLDIPGTGGNFYTPANAETMIAFSAETYVLGGDTKRLFVRALVDGAPVEPSDVVFARTSARQARTMVFRIKGLTDGLHSIQMQWLVDAGGVGGLGDRTVSISSFPFIPGSTHRVVAAPSGPSVQTVSDTWKPVPDLGALIPLPKNGEVAVMVSGEVHATPGHEVRLRLNVGGQVVSEEVVIANDDTPIAVQSFAFDRKHFFGADIGGVTIEWKVSTGGTGTFGDRTMTVLMEAGSVPDLAEAPTMGFGNGKIEPVIGTRKLLTILWDAHRPAPDDNTPAIAEVADALFGAHSVRDYYERSSNGLFSLTNEGILGWYDADKNWDYYWNSHPGCGGGSIYNSGHQEKWAEALLKADASVDFASYDSNQDGVLQPSELGILIVIVQNNDFGTGILGFSPHCDGSPFVVDGVQITDFVEWYTSDPERYFSSAAHELMHLYADLGDLYINGYNADTEVGKLSLMGDNRDTSTHIDPLNKLAMGWLRPTVVESTGFYMLEDVKDSGEVFVLPRRNGGNGTEYFILENRQDSNSDPDYDENIDTQGVIIWHIIEDPAQSDFSPSCMSQTDWDTFVSGNGRRGIRIVRPTISFSNTWSAWNDVRYDIFDGGLVCPAGGDDPLDRRNQLVWADGTPSGYSIVNWPAAGAMMLLEIGVN
ncbi:MAG: M6 family metalloprotease domain-containing protein [Planctomycetota bacterium]